MPEKTFYGDGFASIQVCQVQLKKCPKTTHLAFLEYLNLT